MFGLSRAVWLLLQPRFGSATRLLASGLRLALRQPLAWHRSLGHFVLALGGGSGSALADRKKERLSAEAVLETGSTFVQSEASVSKNPLGLEWGPITLVVDEDWQESQPFQHLKLYLGEKVPPHLWWVVQSSSPDAVRVEGSKLTALLPSGAQFPFCEKDMRRLLREFTYRAGLQPPRKRARTKLESSFAALRAPAGAAAGAQPWWEGKEEAAKLVSEALEAESFAVVDDFLPVDVANQLRQALLEEDCGTGAAWTEGRTDEAEVPMCLPHRGDRVIWVPLARASQEKQWEPFRHLELYVEKFVGALATGPLPEVAKIRWHSEPMGTVYPGAKSARYMRHVDNGNGNGRLLTAIIYLNPEWKRDDGGQLRIFEPGLENMAVKYELPPLMNRLLLFWSDERCPHEVLSTTADRLAVTLWYYSEDPDGFAESKLAELSVSATAPTP